MKNRLLIVFTFLIIQTSLFSQTSLEYGFKAGLNFSGFAHKMMHERTAKFGPQVGVFFRVPSVANNLSLRGDILYSRKAGDIFVSESSILRYRVTNKIDYIDLPIVLEYEFAKNLVFFPGIQFGFLLNQQSKIDETGDEFSHLNLNSFDFGLVGGFMYKINEQLFTELKYNYGFIDVFNDYRSKNSTISICLGYKIN